jgi:hypothetical protein
MGKFSLVTSYSTIRSSITLDEATFACAAVWLGDQNVSCGVRPETKQSLYEAMKKDLSEKFDKGEINETILLMPKYFGTNNYSLKDMLKDDQKIILDIIVQEGVKKATNLNEIIYKDNFAILRFMKEIRVPLPKPFKAATEVALNAEIRRFLAAEEIDVESLVNIIRDAKSFSIEFELEIISLEASDRIVSELTKLVGSPQDIKRVENLEKLISALSELPFKLNLWKAQNIAFEYAQKTFNPLKEKTDEESKAWVSAYQKLCRSIGIRLD